MYDSCYEWITEELKDVHIPSIEMVALPEKVTLFINDECIEIIGDKPYYFFENGVIIKKNG